MRTADDHVDAEERYLIDAINALRREYEAAALAASSAARG